MLLFQFVYLMLVSIHLWFLLQLITASDCIMRNGVTQEITTRYQIITVMSSYYEKSIDVSQFDSLTRAVRVGQIVVI